MNKKIEMTGYADEARQECLASTDRYRLALLNAGYLPSAIPFQSVKPPPLLSEDRPKKRKHVKRESRLMGGSWAELEVARAEIKAIDDSVSQSGHQVLAAVARAHKLQVKDLASKDRFKHFVWARQHAMYELHQLGCFSYRQIGQMLGGRDHSTILYGIGRHRSRIDAEECPK